MFYTCHTYRRKRIISCNTVSYLMEIGLNHNVPNKKFLINANNIRMLITYGLLTYFGKVY